MNTSWKTSSASSSERRKPRTAIAYTYRENRSTSSFHASASPARQARTRSPSGSAEYLLTESVRRGVPRPRAPPAHWRAHARAVGRPDVCPGSHGRDGRRQPIRPPRATLRRMRRPGRSPRSCRQPQQPARRRRHRGTRSRAVLPQRPSSFRSSAKSLEALGPAPASASRRATSAASQARPSVWASATARSLIALACADTPGASSQSVEQRATMPTSRAANATVSAAAEPAPGASPSAERRSSRSWNESAR